MGPTEGWVGRFFSRENAVFTGYAAVFGWLALLACSGGCLCSPERVLALMLLFPSRFPKVLSYFIRRDILQPSLSMKICLQRTPMKVSQVPLNHKC